MRPFAQTVVTPPSVEPISLTEAKLHLRVETDADDDLIGAFIAAARGLGETVTQRAFLEQELEARYSAWPASGCAFWLPSPPLVSVESVKYFDTDGVEQTLSTAVYGVSTDSTPGLVYLKSGQSWPSVDTSNPAPITVAYTAGFTDAAAFAEALPGARVAVLMCVADWYRTRENQIVGTITSKVPNGAEVLFGQCAIPWGY